MINPSLNQIEKNIVEDNIIKDIWNLLKLKKKKDNKIKDKKIKRHKVFIWIWWLLWTNKDW